jgi:ketosteroid isomerase-like protein
MWGSGTQCIKDLLEAMMVGDADRLNDLVSDDVRFNTPPSTMPSSRGPQVGRMAVVALLVNVATKIYEPGSLTLSIMHLLRDGDHAAAHFRLTGRMAGGAPYDNVYVFMFRLSGEKIVEVWEHVDTAYFYGRAGIDPVWTREGV